MNSKIKYLYFFPLFFVASINANAQSQYANEVDIKAAYCLGATQRFPESMVENLSPLAAEIFNLNNANHLRLQKFSIARAKSMNIAAIREMTAALTAGKEAYQRSVLISNACLNEVYPNKDAAWDTVTTKNLQDCAIRKQGKSEVQRLEQCKDLSFLPY
jgi:hypothetical protein